MNPLLLAVGLGSGLGVLLGAARERLLESEIFVTTFSDWEPTGTEWRIDLDEHDPGEDEYTEYDYLRKEARAWRVRDLWELGSGEPVVRVRLSQIPEGDYAWYWSEAPSIKRTAVECARMDRSSLNYPIILDPDGHLMDGAHRLGKAIKLGKRDIKAVVLPYRPEPDRRMKI